MSRGFGFEITATGRDGSSQRVPVGTEMVVIGSSQIANVRLTGERIIPVHVRVLPSPAQVLIVNLARADMTVLNGQLVTTFAPTEWLPGHVLRIGQYQLALLPTGETIEPPVEALADSGYDTSPQAGDSIPTPPGPEAAISRETTGDTAPIIEARISPPVTSPEDDHQTPPEIEAPPAHAATNVLFDTSPLETEPPTPGNDAGQHTPPEAEPLAVSDVPAVSRALETLEVEAEKSSGAAQWVESVTDETYRPPEASPPAADGMLTVLGGKDFALPPLGTEDEDTQKLAGRKNPVKGPPPPKTAPEEPANWGFEVPQAPGAQWGWDLQAQAVPDQPAAPPQEAPALPTLARGYGADEITPVTDDLTPAAPAMPAQPVPPPQEAPALPTLPAMVEDEVTPITGLEPAFVPGRPMPDAEAPRSEDGEVENEEPLTPLRREFQALGDIWGPPLPPAWEGDDITPPQAGELAPEEWGAAQLTPVEQASERFTSVFEGEPGAFTIPHMDAYQTVLSERVREPNGEPRYDTLVKDWHYDGEISAQLTIDRLHVAPGERVRVPVSLRNEAAHAVELQVFVTGLPADWVTLPESSVFLEAGQLRLVDIIIQTPPAVSQESLDAAVRIQDMATAGVGVGLPLRMVFKRTPNLAGWLEPTAVRVPGPAYLYVQNHTQSLARLFIAARSPQPLLEITPEYPEFDLPPGETVRIPVYFRVSGYPLFRQAIYEYGVSVRETTRAPIEYTAQVSVPAQLSAAWLLVFLLVTGMLCMALIVGGFAVTGGLNIALLTATSPASPTPPPTNTPLPTATPRPTDTPQPPTATPTAEFVDPRGPACTAAVPTGWIPYNVRPGDNLFRLALNRGTTIETITAVNCLSGPNYLIAGDTILLPPG